MHITALMKEYGAPMTRDEYLRWTNLGKGTKVSPEEEAELPHRFAYPVVTHNELPEAKPEAEQTKGKGAPADFPGAVFPNEGSIVPQDDDAPPAVAPTRMSGGAKLDKSLGAKAQMDTSNSVKAQIVPDPMVPREQ